MTNSRTYILICALLAALYGLLVFEAPPMVDDFWFLPSGKGWERVVDALRINSSHWASDPARLPNLLAPWFLGFFPRWGLGLTAAALFLLSLLSGWRVAVPSRRATGSGWLWMLLFVVGMPWYDYMLSFEFLLNYLLPTILVLCVWKTFSQEGPSRRPASYGAQLLIALLAGWGHEGLSAPLAGGLAVWWLWDWHSCQRPDWRRFGMLLAVVAGLLIVVFAPAVGQRAAGWGSRFLSMPMWERAFQFGPPLLVLGAALCALSLAWRRLVAKPGAMRNAVCLLLMAVAGLLIMVLFNNGPRTGWSSMLFGMLALCLCLGLRPGLRHGLAIAWAWGCPLACLANLGWAVAEQPTHTRLYDKVMEQYLKSPDGTVYCDIPAVSLTPSLLKTSVRALNERIPLEFISRHFRPGVPLSLLPASIRDFRPEDVSFSRPTEGSPKLGVWRGMVFAEGAVTRADVPGESLNVDFGDRGHRQTRFNPFPFQDSAGASYTWLKLHCQTLDPSLKATRVLSPGDASNGSGR